MSNTKLNSVEKSDLKQRLAVFPGVIVANSVTGVTVAVCEVFPGSNTVKVSTSVQSPDELKFRAKVGKFNALCNMEAGIYVNFPTPFDPLDFADMLSCMAG